MKKSARVSEKPMSPGLPGLQVATRLTVDDRYINSVSLFVEQEIFPGLGNQQFYIIKVKLPAIYVCQR